MSEWIKDGYFYRHELSDGSMSKGDLIFETCYITLRDQDKSDWAYKAMQACANLLRQGKRWPDRMSNDTDCKSLIICFINRKLRQWKIATPEKHRHQKRKSRDPFQALYTVCVFLDRKQFIEAAPMPWYIYSPEIWRWRRRLIKDERLKYKRRLGWIRAKGTVLNQPEFE